MKINHGIIYQYEHLRNRYSKKIKSTEETNLKQFRGTKQLQEIETGKKTGRRSEERRFTKCSQNFNTHSREIKLFN